MSDPEYSNSGAPESEVFTLGTLRSELSPSDLGAFMLMEATLNSTTPELTSIEQKQLRLADIQQRHHLELQDQDVLIRAYINVSEIDFREESRPLLPASVPFRAKVFQSLRRYNDKSVEVLGIRFATIYPDAEGNVDERTYDVLVTLGDETYPPFGEEDAQIVRAQIKELRALQTELSLEADLSRVAELPAF
jgi:hypothetical protein